MHKLSQFTSILALCIPPGVIEAMIMRVCAVTSHRAGVRDAFFAPVRTQNKIYQFSSKRRN